MFIDARQIESGSLLQTNICIVGGGVAGITIALELKRNGIDCCILESGGMTPDPATQDLYQGDNIGLPYIAAEACRSRYFGGSSNCWGGWCAPLEQIDFSARSWVSNSGWPFDLVDLNPYYNRAHEVLHLGAFSYDLAQWEKLIGRPDVNRMAGDDIIIRDMMSQFSPPVRLGTLHREEFKNSPRVTVFLNANVLKITTNDCAGKVERVRVATLRGKSFEIAANQFILATGGIENARLLLSSNEISTNGLGNDEDLVGRYFMEHPRLLTGDIRFSKSWSGNRLYDIKYNYHSPSISAQGTCIAGQISLRPEVQEREALLNARVSFSSVFPGEGTHGANTLWRFKEALAKRDLRKINFARDLYTILRNPLHVTSYGLTRIYRPKSLVKGVKFQIISEQEPNPGSRIRLTKERDRLGLQKVSVEWRLGEMEKRTINRTLELVAEQLHRKGIATEVKNEFLARESEWPDHLEGAWHHMGTTRMHDSPRKGVVNRDCRLHNTHNLFIGGSSVFPTGGANFPTITIAALAIRLADHLQKNARQEKIILMKAPEKQA